MELTLSIDPAKKLTGWEDASYAVHSDMNGHTGGTLPLGCRSVYSLSAKPKLVSWSSTEAKLIGVYDALPQMIWAGNILQAQGLDIGKVVLKQDNMSSILLASNERTASMKHTKHLAIRYFYIKEKVDKKEVTIEYCLTHDMTADYFMKPFQGKLFHQLRDHIMGIDLNDKYRSGHRSVLGKWVRHNEQMDMNQTQTDEWANVPGTGCTKVWSSSTRNTFL